MGRRLTVVRIPPVAGRILLRITETGARLAGQPTILTKAPSASATLTVLYCGDSGQQATAVASAPIVR